MGSVACSRVQDAVAMPGPVHDGKKFENWSGNLKTALPVQEPKNDQEIIDLIKTAKSKGQTVRVVGHAHSQPPLVASNADEASKVVVMRMKKYKGPTEDFVWHGAEGDALRRVTVNAGWSFDQLYNVTVPKGYFLKSQTAGNQFSIAGCVLNTVHGGNAQETVLADQVTGLRVIDAQGEVHDICEEEQLRMVRGSLGAFGVCTHVTIEMRRLTKITPAHLDLELELTEEEVQAKVLSSLDEYPVQEFFWDMVSKRLLNARWKLANDPAVKPSFQSPELNERVSDDQHTAGMPVSNFLNTFKSSHTINQLPLAQRLTVDGTMGMFTRFLDQDANTDNDMFVAEYALPCLFMAYFFPINKPGDVVDVFKAVMDVREQAKTDEWDFLPDSLLEFRFLRATPNVPFSGVYQRDGHKREPSKNQLFMGVEIFAFVGTDDVTFSAESLKTETVQGIGKYWYFVEQRWRAIPGSKPHYGKMYGFRPSDGDNSAHVPFDPKVTGEIYSADVKAELLQAVKKFDPDGLFWRDFHGHLLGTSEKDPALHDSKLAAGDK